MSDTTLRNYITKIPTVQANGDFSMELYRQMLAAQGLTMNGFEAGVRRDLAIGRVLEPVGMTARAPRSGGFAGNRADPNPHGPAAPFRRRRLSLEG